MRYKAAALSFILFPTNKMNISLEICISSCGLPKSHSSNILNPKSSLKPSNSARLLALPQNPFP